MNTHEAEYTIQTSGTAPETVESLTQALKTKGFGVLSTINVSKIIKENTGEDINSYFILDVCNAKDAVCALKTHKEVGLVLPCKVTVYEDADRTWVSLYKPTEALKVLDLDDLEPLAVEVEMKLREVIDEMRTQKGD